jgi:hypothetical protein
MKPSPEKQEFSQRQPADSWLGIIPGVNKLDDAKAKWGPISRSGRLANATWHEFVDNTIQVLILDRDAEQEIITRIRVKADCPIKDSIPQTLAQARKTFAALKKTSIDELGTVMYECPGLRIVCELFGKPAKVKWIEFYSCASNN